MKYLIAILILTLPQIGYARKVDVPCTTRTITVLKWHKVVSEDYAEIAIDFTGQGYGQYRTTYLYELQPGSLLITSIVPDHATLENLDTGATDVIVNDEKGWKNHFGTFCVKHPDFIRYED